MNENERSASTSRKGDTFNRRATDHYRSSDVRVRRIRVVLPPAILREEIPLSDEDVERVLKGREEVKKALHGASDRLVVVVGPCSIHNVDAGLEYADRLARLNEELSGQLSIIMRAYFEKPRSTVGWKGLINDPHLDSSYAVNEGLRRARTLLVEINKRGLLAGSELLEPTSPQYMADALGWAAIGARTVESQVHRQLASGASMPIGFKNNTNGDIKVALDAIKASASPHCFLGLAMEGMVAIVETEGNPVCHLILRGGKSGTNCDSGSIANAAATLEEAGLPPRLMVDCSHANSRKDPRRQIENAKDIADQIAVGATAILGVMLESFLVEGRQDLGNGRDLTYGQSVTDPCIGWDQTETVLRMLADAVEKKRSTGR